MNRASQSVAGPDASQCRLITAGIDTLDLSFYVQWPSDRLHNRLAALREDAMGTDGIQPDNCDYLVLPSGKPPMYRYHLEYREGEVFLSDNPEVTNHPNVYVSISAKTLWLQGLDEAVAIFRRHIQALGGVIESIVPSRVDLAADLVIPGGLSFDFLRPTWSPMPASVGPGSTASAFETFYIGVGDLQVRIYDKSAEILHSGKVFFFDVWRNRLPDIGEGVAHVWRVEGQIRRPVLKQYGIDALDGFASCLPGLWQAITNWASLHCSMMPTPHAARSIRSGRWSSRPGAPGRWGRSCCAARSRNPPRRWNGTWPTFSGASSAWLHGSMSCNLPKRWQSWRTWRRNTNPRKPSPHACRRRLFAWGWLPSPPCRRERRGGA